MTIEKRFGGVSIGPVTAMVSRLRPIMHSGSSGHPVRPNTHETQSGG